LDRIRGYFCLWKIITRDFSPKRPIKRRFSVTILVKVFLVRV
jgi:hypothetical protein